jgi:N-methylhydantoinase A
MGGTSTDVALIVDGQAEVAPQTEIDGLPVRMPVIDIVTVGAGGGSIAWVDDGGFLRAGPHSAGAEPGPASYLRGGTLPTITDAHLIRGTLQASSFLGGSMTVDRKAAVDAFQDLAARLTLPIEELADSVIRIAEGNIVRAIQQVSTERGHDPRDFTLVAFGGAGPLHAARLAEDLEIQTVLVPPIAGVLSAAGLLMSDYVHYRSRTERVRLDEGAMSAVTAILHALRADAECYLRETGIDAPLIFEPILEMRYQGQAFEISVPINSDIDRLTRDAILTAFADAHHRIFEFSKQTEDPVEIVSFRIGARARVNDLPVRGGALERIQNVPEPSDMIITEGGKALTCRLLHRTHVTSALAAGPLLIDDDTSTIYTPPGWTARQDNTGSLILQRSA